ncbi:MAG: DUF1501 domain-containing protein [Planctomycetes bacterium]|nr:DUF1501 domain-containing protein [Planctomycetota bacterium]
MSSSLSRREFLRAGALALGGVTLADVLAARAAKPAARDTSVILLYLHGGPSHLETYDLKPDAPLAYRSVFNPIRTNVPGIDVCEHFPRQAKIADKFALVRSLNHDVNIHSDGGIVVLTGKRPTVLDPLSQSKSEHPDVGSVTSFVRGPHPAALPPYVALPQAPYMTRPTYLGHQHGPFAVGDPSTPYFRPPLLALGGDTRRLDDRKKLLGDLDTMRRDLDASGKLATSDTHTRQAFELLSSKKVAEAFDLSRESDKTRDRYGRHLWGQSCLLARRLAAAGTAVVNLYINTPKNGDEFTNWDDHIQNAGRPGHFAGFMKTRLPYMDEALSALIEDIYARGLDNDILVVVMGEFGRTPRLSMNANGTGRDHWPQAYTALVSGGGFKMGQAIGATNARGEFPAQKPYTPYDLLATVYKHLGIDRHKPLYDATNKPVPVLPDGDPIPELG